MLPFLGALIGPITSTIGSLGKSWLETKKVKAEGKIAITAAKVEAKVKKIEQQGEMDLKSTDGMSTSFKDESLLILLSIPIIMCFIPGLAQYALAGFAILETTPDWLKWALTGMIAASFGLRTWTGFRK